MSLGFTNDDYNDVMMIYWLQMHCSVVMFKCAW